MNVVEKDYLYLDGEKKISFQKKLDNSLMISMQVFIGSEKFFEYQKDLLQGFFIEFTEKLEKNHLEGNPLKTDFEKLLQDCNIKLHLFADKIKDTAYFPLTGMVQVFHNEEYIASMIGSISTMIFRKGKMAYSLSNEINSTYKIDQFSDVIEGELENKDTIIFVGTNIEPLIDKQDIAEIQEVITQSESSIADLLNELLKNRVSPEQIGFINEYVYETDERKNFIETKTNIQRGNMIKKKYDAFQINYTGLIVGLSIAVIVFLGYSMYTSLNKTQGEIITNTDGSIIADLTIEDIQKEISIFQKIDASSDGKGEKYNEIMEKISILEQKNKRPNDIMELKKLLQEEYFKGFNIIRLDNAKIQESLLYEIAPNEAETLGGIKKIIFDKAGYIIGEQGVLFGLINNDIRGSIVKYNVNFTPTNCDINILNNGLYCFNAQGEIYNILKSGIETVSSSDSKFPTQIKDLKVYGKGSFFVMTQDPEYNNNNVSIVRYNNVLGSQNQFQQPIQYKMLFYNSISGSTETTGATINNIMGYNTMSIDGTFLTRSPSEKQLMQYRREGTTFNLNSRIIPLQGGEKSIEQYSDEVEIFSSINSVNVYLFDKKSQTLTMYRSNPNKTNDAYNKTYSLSYVFRMKFDLGENTVIDMYVNENDKPIVYVLTNNGVYALKIQDFIELLPQ